MFFGDDVEQLRALLAQSFHEFASRVNEMGHIALKMRDLTVGGWHVGLPAIDH